MVSKKFVIFAKKKIKIMTDDELVKEAIFRVCERLYKDKGVFKSAIRNDDFVFAATQNDVLFTTDEMVDFFVEAFHLGEENIKDKIL